MVTGCGDTATAPGHANDPDTGGLSDADTPLDAGIPPDTGDGTDSGDSSNVTPARDAGSTDTATLDTAPSLDAASRPDARLSRDAGTEPDAVSDTGRVADTGHTADASAPTDSSQRPDAGRATDVGYPPRTDAGYGTDVDLASDVSRAPEVGAVEVDAAAGTCSTCADNDGCCPAGCYVTTDNDCSLDCRDASTWPPAWTALEDRVLVLTNQERAAGATCGANYYAPAAPLTSDPQLREAARCHSLDMAVQDYFSHDSLDGSSFVDRINAAGYTWRAVAENIAGGYGTEAAVIAGWMNSPGHCVNIMADYDEVGVGYAQDARATYRYLWTQDFGTP